MKRLAKIAISSVYWMLFGLVLRRKDRLVILYYHSVPDTKRTTFARQLDSLRRKARVVPANWNEIGKARQSLVAITFDDAFQSVIDNALPELAARDMPCTIFAPSAALGAPPRWEMESNADQSETVISAETLRRLGGSLVTVGSHSESHPRLGRLPIEAAQSEIAGSKTALETLLGRAVDQFAFPYGDFNAGVVAACRDAGYAHVYSISPVPVDPARNPFVRGRVAVEPDDGPLEFYLKSNGAYAWMPLASAFKRRLAARAP